MPRLGTSYVLSKPTPHTQLNTTAGSVVQSLTLDPNCAALLVSGVGSGTNLLWVTFDGSTPSAANGIVIQSAGQPVLIPLGYYGDVGHVLKFQGSAASAILNIVQLA